MKKFFRRLRLNSTDPIILLRALWTSLVVGTILVAINQLGPVLKQGVTMRHLLKIGLTYVVPYGVSTFTAIRTQLRLSPNQETPVSATYKCEKCTMHHRDHRLFLHKGDNVPECPRFGEETDYVIYREE